jgi:RHH-type rel operon transcriptional repressor/antitoxin RelB
MCTDYADYNDSADAVPTTVRLEPELEARLNHLAASTGRTKAFYLRELITQGLDDLEDAYLGAAVVERLRRGQETTRPLNDVAADLDLDD